MKLFIWDFHGVLEKGNEFAVQELTNNTLEEFGYKRRLTQDETLALYGNKWHEYFSYLLPDEPHEVHMRLQSATVERQDWTCIERYIKPNNHSHLVLDAIQKKHDQVVISNTQPKSLTMFLRLVKQDRFFPSSHAFAVSAHDDSGHRTKEEALHDFLKTRDYDGVVIIGDSPSDMNLRKVAGGTTYLYTHPHLPHKDCDADYKIADLRMVLNET